jgi:3-phosphoshikimate 1-carboxyvinyltransferase
LLIAALAQGRSRLRNLSPGEDVEATRRLIEALGAEVTVDAGELVVESTNRDRSRSRSVDCGNSGTTMRLGAGALAGVAGVSTLWGDASLSTRPMQRVLDPLGSMGAKVRSTDGHAPIEIEGGDLHGIDFTPPVASAQVKGAVLLAGLAAEGETVVREPVATRAHTEEMLRDAGADIVVADGSVRVRPSRPNPVDIDIPGDPSAAAFWAVAASIVPESRLRIEGIYRGPARGGFLDVLGRMGADVTIVERGPNLVDIEVRAAALRGTDISDPLEIAATVDELPAIAVAAAFATGTTSIKGAQELRLKESDRLRALSESLGGLGATVQEVDDGLVIEGSGPEGLAGGSADAHGDHRIAMAVAVAGLACRGTTIIEGWQSVRVSDPHFEAQIEMLRSA